jgi:GGDEF domain-containing protein
MKLIYSASRLPPNTASDDDSCRPAQASAATAELVPVMQGWEPFEAALGRQISAGRRYGVRPAVMVLELRLQGFAFGDPQGQPSQPLLQAVGARVRSRVRSTDLVMQVGERHFGVVLIGAGQEHMSPIQQRLLRALAGPYSLSSSLQQLSFRAGAAAFPDVSISAKALVEAALAAKV